MVRHRLTSDVWHHKGVATFTLLRGLAAASIVISPVWGYSVSLILDVLDGRILLSFGNLDKLAYDLWDKVLDSAGFVAELIVAAKTSFIGMFWGLFIYRMIGHAIFWVTKRPSLLVFFPNLFESAFLWFLIPTTWYRPWLTPVGALWLLFALKIVQETFLHWFWPKYWGRKWHQHLLRIFGQKSIVAVFFSTSYPAGYEKR